MKKLIKKLLRHNIDRLMGGSVLDLKRQNISVMNMLRKEHQAEDQRYRDLVDLVVGAKSIRHNRNIKLVTEHPVAYDSIDHIDPAGTIDDNTRHYGFYNKCRLLYGENLSFLDLGCSGGGLVFEFALNGHVAIGLEGSDISKTLARANWRTIPDNLFCCDITKEFELRDCTKNATSCFNVISCWEALEHIPESSLEGLFNNIKRHSEDGGIFIGSVCTRPSRREHHVTVKDESWWMDQFSEHGFRVMLKAEIDFEFYEFCRPFPDTEIDLRKHPNEGFHFVAQKR